MCKGGKSSNANDPDCRGVFGKTACFRAHSFAGRFRFSGSGACGVDECSRRDCAPRAHAPGVIGRHRHLRGAGRVDPPGDAEGARGGSSVALPEQPARQALPPGLSVQKGKAEQPYLSWNARILPYLEQADLWQQVEQAFRQDRDFLNVPPHTLRSEVIPAFACPIDSRVSDGSNRSAFTSYVGVEGTDQYRGDGLLFLDSKVRLASILDGASNTLMVGERPPSADGYLGWWYAGWGQEQDGSAEMVLGVREFCVFNVASCPDGPYHYGPGRFSNQCDVYHFWSPHSGGANFAFADGSVRFLSYSADSIMPALATRAGGEKVAIPD